MAENTTISRMKAKLSSISPQKSFEKILITTFITLIVVFYNTWGEDIFSSKNSELATAEDEMKAARKKYDDVPRTPDHALNLELAKTILIAKTKEYNNMYSTLKNPQKVTFLNKTMNSVILILIGVTTMMLYAQYNGIEDPVKPNIYDIDTRWGRSALIKGAVGAIILSLIVTGNPESRHPLPMFLAALLGFCLGVLVHFKKSTIDLFNQSLQNVSMLMKIVFVIAVLFGFIWLVQTYSTLSTSLSVIVSLCFFGFGLFYLYKLTYNNSWFRKLFRKNSLLRFIYYLVFAIPCIVSFVFDGFLSDFGNAPSYVLQILLVEIIVLVLYILIPFIIKKLYIHNPVGANTERLHHIKKQMDALKTSMSNQHNEINNKKAVISGITWDVVAPYLSDYIDGTIKKIITISL